MPFSESVFVAFFMLVVVFAVLFGLFMCIQLVSIVLHRKTKTQSDPQE